ncbi:MAG: rhomboid family intramembrane serine protease [Verrucomicrobiota bacterium]
MSIYSRDYMRDGSSQRAGDPSTWNVVTWLLVLNTVVFVVNLASVDRVGAFLKLPAPYPSVMWLWTPITYQFTHFGLLHFAGNMLGLFFLGRFLLGIVGPRKLLRIYLLGGLMGAVFHVLYAAVTGQLSTVEGASGSVLAMLTVAATLIPHQKFQLLLFFVLPISMTLRTVLWLSIGLNVIFMIMDLTGQPGSVSFMAHFGGIFFGWLYAKYLYNPHEDTERTWKFPIRILKDSDPSEPKARKTKKRKKKKAFVSTDVDAILDKINAEGFQSLTDEEKQLLEKSSERLSKRLDEKKKEE